MIVTTPEALADGIVSTLPDSGCLPDSAASCCWALSFLQACRPNNINNKKTENVKRMISCYFWAKIYHAVPDCADQGVSTFIFFLEKRRVQVF